MSGFDITGWGESLPDKIITNLDLEARLDTSDEWIRERTGIEERRVGESTAELAIEAGRAALEMAGVGAADIDIVVLCTTTPDQAVPATSAHVQDALGIGGGAFDINAACSGFVYGLVASDGLIRSGANRILLIGAETLSRITDWEDRDTAVLFGDGAGAVVLEQSDHHGQLLSWDLGADGSTRHILYADRGGHLKMDGKEVFRRAVRVVVDSATNALDRAGVEADELALFIPHQANVRIMQAVAQRLGIDEDRIGRTIEKTGNTSAASIPLTLVDSARAGRLQPGDRLLLSGFGAGMTWASAIVQWGEQ